MSTPSFQDQLTAIGQKNVALVGQDKGGLVDPDGLQFNESLRRVAMEKGEDRNLLWWLTLQRFGYRQIMYYVVLKSLATALSGPFVGWGTLVRKATVKTS